MGSNNTSYYLFAFYFFIVFCILCVYILLFVFIIVCCSVFYVIHGGLSYVLMLVWCFVL